MSRPNIPEITPHQNESPGERSARLAKENPIMSIGLAGAVGIVLYRIFNIKNRNKSQRFANYVVYTRMYAQGLLVVCFGYGVVLNVYKHYSKKWFGEATEKTGTKSIEEK